MKYETLPQKYRSLIFTAQNIRSYSLASLGLPDAVHPIVVTLRIVTLGVALPVVENSAAPSVGTLAPGIVGCLEVLSTISCVQLTFSVVTFLL